MYSDFIESPSKDCFSFNDQSSSYDMAEVNEISNQTNLDYIFDSYYSSVSQYNSNFELPEDCKNMSFSELFDQELFSTNENKDCQITIKIEEEEEEEQSSNPCYSVDDSQDIGNHNSTQIEENVPSSSSLSKSFAPKRGINRTFIKTTDNCDVKQLMCNPFFETDDIGIDKISVKVEKPCIKLESENVDTIEQNIVGMEVKLCCSSDDSQNVIDNHKLVTIKDGHSPLMSKTPIPKHQGITRTFIKSTENSFYAPNNLSNDQISVVVNPSIPKLTPENFNDNIEQNIVGLEIQSCNSADNLSRINDSHRIVNVKDNITSSVSNSSIQKLRGIDKNSMNSTYHCDVKSHFYQEHGIDHKPVKADSSIMNREPGGINYTVEMETRKHNAQHTIDSHGILKINGKIPSKLSKNTISKSPGITRTSIKSTENSDVKHPISNSFHDKMSVKINQSLVKCDQKNMNNNIKQNIEMKIKSCGSADDLQRMNNSDMIVKVQDNITSSISRGSIQKGQGIYKTTSEPIKNSDIKRLMYNKLCQSKKLALDLKPVKIVKSFIKSEPEDTNETTDQNINEKKIQPHYYSQKNTIHNQSILKIRDKVPSVLSKNSIPKRQVISRKSIKSTECSDGKNLMSNCHYVSQDLGNNKMLVKIIPYIAKCEPKSINNNIKQNIKTEIQSYSSSDDLRHISNNVKVEDNIAFSLSKSSSPKYEEIIKTSLKTTKKSEVNNPMYNKLSQTKDLELDQKSIKFKSLSVKREPEDIFTAGQNISGMEVKSFSSIDGLKNTMDDSSVKVENPDQKNQSNNIISLKTTKKSEINNLMYNKLSQTKDLELDQKSMKLKSLTVKRETEDIFNTAGQNISGMEVKSFSSIDSLKNAMDHSSVKVENPDPKNQSINIISLKTTKNCEDNIEIQQNIVKMEIQTNDTNLDCENKIKYNDPNEIWNPSNVTIECVNSQNCNIKNELNMETEKKKISMEEYRAKRGKISILQNTPDNITEFTTELVETDKLKAIKEEFDRNTEEHFIGQKRKIDDEEHSPLSKEIINEEDQELQNKRMKFEYIKKLLPSSFASEIAKTSSLMKGVLVDDNENENNSDDSTMSNDKTPEKFTEMHDELGYSKKDEKSQRKGYPNKVHPSHRSSRSEYCNKSGRSSSLSSNSDDFYNRNRIDSPQQNGQYGQNVRNSAQRSKEQKRVVYVGQIPIKFGKRYLYSRFEEFGSIISLTLHKKPDFRVYYAFVTYSDKAEAERAISHGNDDRSQVQLDIRFGERKQTQTPYYDLDDEWLTDWYGYNPPVPVVRTRNSPEKVSFQEELQEFYKLAQIKKLNQKSSQNS